MSPTRHVTTADGVALAYRVIGDGPVDLLWSFNQLGDVEVVWEYPAIRRFLEALAASTRLILHDRRGMGRSGGERGDVATEVSDLATLLDAVEAPCPYLAGVLTGGAAYAAFAAAHPGRVAGLVWYVAFARYLRSPDYPWGATASELEEEWLRLEEQWGTDAFAEHFISGDPAIAGDPAAIRFFARWMQETGSGRSVAAADRAWARVDLHPVLRSLATPTLIISPQGDDPDEAAYVTSLVPGATMVIIDRENFMPFFESEPILAAIRDFIDASSVPRSPSRSRPGG